MTHSNKFWDNECMSCLFNTPRGCFDSCCDGCPQDLVNKQGHRCKCFEENIGQGHCPYYKEE